MFGKMDLLTFIIMLPFLPFYVLASAVPQPPRPSETSNNSQNVINKFPNLLPLPPLLYQPRTEMRNIEEIEWEDWRGRKRMMKIHRKAEII